MHTILVVLYKRLVSDSETLTSLILCENISKARLVLWNNGTEGMQNVSEADLSSLKNYFNDVQYINTDVNESLSKIYNQVGDNYLLELDDVLSIFDHDTVISKSFVSNVESINKEACLILPKIVSNKSNLIISPRRQNKFYLFTKYLFSEDFNKNDTGYFSSHHLFAVGSGLTITKKLWDDNLRFDNNTIFYGVDTEFCNDYQNHNKNFYLLSDCLVHDVSSETGESKIITNWRFNKYMDYWKYQLKKHANLPSFVTNIYVELYRRTYNFYFTYIKK
jgi:GT2 family glycosyltransferase